MLPRVLYQNYILVMKLTVHYITLEHYLSPRGHVFRNTYKNMDFKKSSILFLILTFKLQIQPVSILFLIPDLYKYLVVLNANTDHFLQLFIIKFSVLSQKIVSNIVIFMLHGVKWPYFTP